MQHQIKKLRDGAHLRLWDRVDKNLVHIQLNRKDKINWQKRNGYLSLREVWILLQGIKEKKEVFDLIN